MARGNTVEALDIVHEQLGYCNRREVMPQRYEVHKLRKVVHETSRSLVELEIGNPSTCIWIYVACPSICTIWNDLDKFHK